MHSDVLMKVIKPEHCLLAFGIPVTEDDFLQRKHLKHGFAYRFSERYGETAVVEYQRQFLNELRRIEPRLKWLGLKVMHRIDQQRFYALMHQQAYDVIILFSHSAGDLEAIEFSDGFMSYQDVLESIPSSYGGFVDFSVCKLTPLAMELKWERLKTTTRYSINRALPFFWLGFYLNLFEHLEREDKTYLQAYNEVVAEYLRTLRKGRCHVRLRNFFQALFK